MSFTKRVTENGYRHLTNDELYVELVKEAAAQGITILPNSDDWAIAKFLTETFDSLYSELNQIRANFNPLEAGGNALNELCLLKSIERGVATKATVRVSVEGVDTQYAFAEGSIKVSDDKGNSFKNTNAVTVTGTTIINFTSTVTGKGNNVSAGVITKIDTDPSGKITKVSNPNNASGGKDIESDEELRFRLINTYPSVLSVTRLEQELSKIDGVTYARVFNNYVGGETINGVPFKSSAVVIDDGRTTNDFTSDTGKKIWETMRAHSVTNENWYKPTNAVPIVFSYNGARLEYPIIKPVVSNVKYRVTIKNTNNKSDDLEKIIYDIIATIIKNKPVGSLLTGAEVLSQLFAKVEDCKTSSALTVEVAKSTDTTAWGAKYSLQMQYSQKPVLAVKNVEVLYSSPVVA